MKIEILFPELCSLYGDQGNILILEQTFGKKNITKTPIIESPAFLEGGIDMVYMGAMSEETQVMVLEKLRPHRHILKELFDAGLFGLFTGNAMDILGKVIIEEDGSEILGLGYFDFKTVIKRVPRLYSVIYGHYKDIDIVGYKTQFTQAYANNHDNYLFKLKTGMGINNKSTYEGFQYKNLIATNMTGPFLVKNPGFARSYLGVFLAHHELLEKAQRKIIEDINKL